MQTPTNTELAELASLADAQLSYEKMIANLEEQVSEAKESLRKIQEQMIPELMQSIGMSKFTLENGFSITIKDDVFASMRKDYTDEAIHWLDEHGLGDIVKNKVEVQFSRGSSTNELLSYCKQHGLNAAQNKSIHASTLKATVKEQLARGVEFPEEYFSIHPFKKAVIKTK